jgi:hypothetical protein
LFDCKFWKIWYFLSIFFCLIPEIQCKIFCDLNEVLNFSMKFKNAIKCFK